MSRQAIIGAFAAALIAALVAWIARNTYWEEVTVPAFPRGEAARNPFYAAQNVTEALGASTEWRRTLGELPGPREVLVLTYWHWGLIDRRRARIEEWVESGGRLVLVGNLTGGGDALEEWSGLAHDHEERASEGDGADSAGEGEPDAGDAGPEVYVTGVGPCPTLGIAAGASHTNPSREDYTVCDLGSGLLFSAREPEWAVVHTRDVDEPWLQAARVPVGEGSVAWINADLFAAFDARNFLDADHALLFVDAAELRRGDHVVFVSEEQSAPLLELVWTYGAPGVVLFLVLVALALWRNAARFGPLVASPDPARRSLAEQIRGTAQFALRVGGGESLHAAMVRALHEGARLRIPGYERMDIRKRIVVVARLSGIDADRLTGAIQADRHAHAHELKTAVALLDAARRNLMAGLARRGRGRRRGVHKHAVAALEPVEP